MTIEDLGYDKELDKFKEDQNLTSFAIGRVIAEHKERYVVKSPESEFDAELIGNLRFTAESRYDFPAVGDWVAFSEFDAGKALIHAIYPRRSVIERQAVGKTGQVQIIGTNIDYGIIVQAVDRDFNLNRLERYRTICNASEVMPVIVLSKVDLINDAELDSLISQIKQRSKDVPVIAISNQPDGYKAMEEYVESSKTYCLLGSSGVGKSTLLNHLSGSSVMETAEISTSVGKGKHTTSHRELFVLPGGSIFIDNPGMREVGIADTTSGLETTFDDIMLLAQQCRFTDCTHMHEDGCAVVEAVENGEIEEGAYANFRKMQKEKMHFESDAQERKKKDKDLGKLIKNMKKERKGNKY